MNHKKDKKKVIYFVKLLIKISDFKIIFKKIFEIRSEID